MKASVQFPQYKGESTPNNSVQTMVEHFDDETRRTGTKTVTRTITPTGEMAVYASQSSVRFKMTSNRNRQELGEAGSVTLPRPRYERFEDKSLYPVTVTSTRTQPDLPRRFSAKEEGLTRQGMTSPDFNILLRDTGLELRTTSKSAPQQGYSVVVAIDFGELQFTVYILLHSAFQPFSPI